MTNTIGMELSKDELEMVTGGSLVVEFTVSTAAGVQPSSAEVATEESTDESGE